VHVLYHHRTAGDRVEAVHILGMVHALEGLGHTVEVSSPPGCDPSKKQTDCDSTGERAPAEGRLRKTLKWLARKAPPLVFELVELCYNAYSLADMAMRAKRRRPDMVYERTTSNSIAPTLLACHWGIPIVQEVNVTTEVGRLRPLVLHRLTKAIEQWVRRRATLVTTVSEAFRMLLLESGWPADRIVICQNAVDPEEFDNDRVSPVTRPETLGEDAFVIGYVGAFVPYHRLGMLVSIAHELAPQYPHARWLLVGDGVERPRIESLLSEFGLKDKFWMAGKVPHRYVPSYIVSMDAAVLPNSETFNSPMKLFEYMAMGKAVIAPRVAAIEEVVRHGETGLLFEPGDLASLRATIELVLSDHKLRETLGSSAREYVLENHTWVKNAKRVIASLNHRQRTRTG